MVREALLKAHKDYSVMRGSNLTSPHEWFSQFKAKGSALYHVGLFVVVNRIETVRDPKSPIRSASREVHPQLCSLGSDANLSI